MKNEFLNELRMYAEKYGVDSEILVDKYSKRFDLALEAGFSEEEAISKFGDPEKIVLDFVKSSTQTNEEENTKIFNTFDDDYIEKKFLTVEIEHSNVLVKLVSSDDEDSISYKIDGDSDKTIDVAITPDGFDIHASNFFMKNNADCEITVYLNKKFRFENVSFNIYSGAVDASEFTMFAEKVELEQMSDELKLGNVFAEKIDLQNVDAKITAKLVNSKKIDIDNVSGNIKINSLIADSLDLSTVSGDVTIEAVICEKAELSSINGKIIVSGDISDYSTNSISGDIEINAERVSEDLIKKIFTSFSNATENGFVDLSFIPDAIKPTIDKIKKQTSDLKPKFKSFIDRMKNKK